MNKTKIKLVALTRVISCFFNGAKSCLPALPVPSSTFGRAGRPHEVEKNSSHSFIDLHSWSSPACRQAGAKRIKKSVLISIALIFLIQPQASIAQTVTEQGDIPSEFAQHGLETLNKMIGAINVFLALLFIVSIIGFVVSGIKFIIAGGDEGMLESARKTGIASVVGFLLSLVGYVIINIIKHFIV
ncbi:MAG: hypothetical protein U9M90_03915 [Patescibacteria group bacterium]|nr:hypothetical protein [Patescibacteria group bacterium]